MYQMKLFRTEMQTHDMNRQFHKITPISTKNRELYLIGESSVECGVILDVVCYAGDSSGVILVFFFDIKVCVEGHGK